MPYLPIEDHGIIGDMHTAALVGMDGSIDWFCFPFFDSPSVFAAILDDEKGGCFSIAPSTEGAACKQFYWPETNVLTTQFLSAEGVGEVTDFMPVGAAAREFGYHEIVRRVSVVRGEMRFRMLCTPAFDYGRGRHETVIRGDGAVFHSAELSLMLATRQKLSLAAGGGVSSEFILRQGETALFVLKQADPDGQAGPVISENEAHEQFHHTVAYWRHWISKCRYTGRWREVVHRSALVLKLLTFEPTGAIVAAPTTSLPEALGGARNWDYRYTWIRDAAFTLYGLLRIGFTDEAAEFMAFLEFISHEANIDAPLQVMYGIDGRQLLDEETLDHLEGYKGSRPVRIGNKAYAQLQLDIYGELMDSVYLYNKHGSPISYDLWRRLRLMADWVCENWSRPDKGIWEIRGESMHFVYSKVMCWVAIDRALRLADKRSFPAARARWLETRDRIYEEIMAKGWSPSHRAFVQHYGSESLDAANLIMPLVFFVSPSDRRMISTLQAINKPPDRGGLVSDSLVHRYDVRKTEDGVGGDEGTFNMCTFWLVEAMTRAGKTDHMWLDHARLMFEKMLGYSNHLGLYSEQTGPRGEALGNFPQAFTHLALISAAFNLDRALGTRD